VVDQFLAWMLERISRSKILDHIVLTTTNNKDDYKLVDWVYANSFLSVFRGSTKNLLSRYYKSVVQFNADPIVRRNINDLLKDLSIIDHATKLLDKKTQI